MAVRLVPWADDGAPSDADDMRKSERPRARVLWVDTFEASWKGEGVPESMSQRDVEGRMEQWCRGESSAVFGGDGRRGREFGCERRGAWCGREQRAK